MEITDNHRKRAMYVLKEWCNQSRDPREAHLFLAAMWRIDADRREDKYTADLQMGIAYGVIDSFNTLYRRRNTESEITTDDIDIVATSAITQIVSENN